MTIEIGLALTILSVVIALQGYQLNKQKHRDEQTEKQTKEEKDDAKESAEIKAQLGYISKGVDDIRIDLKANERQMAALGERVTRVEESSKQAHKRLDNLESKGDL
ncbi:hypothetical protein M3175_07760 [Robertmurraya korlensis]|uniref:hypothetical protein n=1 Tax=Robertmurraya korlensis TaxID=519977 RepID=UPI00203CEE76|nr:hypothetical protein [Robertmurraya korlensis]MCM3600623.1 hypothetical protein [Robertmurraya korlensis]